MIMRMQTDGIVAVEPKAEVQKEWHDGIQQKLKGTVWEVDWWVALESNVATGLTRSVQWRVV
jgi:hypothetical protein